MALIKYAAGVPPIPAKWSKLLSNLLDSIGLSTVTITSTRRSLESNSLAMYNNIKVAGVNAAYDLYNANMDTVIRVYDESRKAGRNQADTLSAMTAQSRKVPVPVHCRPQDDSFCVFDIPPSYIPQNMRAAFERVMRQNGKLIVPTSSKSEPVYHMEFGGLSDAAKTASGIGAGAVAMIVAIAFVLLKK